MKIVSMALAVWMGLVDRAATLQIVSGAFSTGKSYLTCTIDGVKERCFVDTGSALTIVPNSKRFARYTNMGAFHFKSAADIEQQIDTIHVESIQIDEIAFPHVKVGRANFRAVEKTIGNDILGKQPFAMRFRSRPTLELNAERPASAAATLVVSKQGLFAIPVEIGGSGMRGLWDTGESITSVDQAFIAAHPEDFKAVNKYSKGFDGAGKPLLLKAFRANKIAIAGHTFEDVYVVAADLSLLRDNLSKEIEAVVGFNLIRKGNWFFDAKNRMWSFEM
jgi:predicted aspartyl protease